MKTALHKINTTDGIVLHGLVYEPDSTTKKVVAHVHGMGGNFYENFFLEPIASALTEKGVAFSPFNNRGNGLVTSLINESDGTFNTVEGGTYKERFEDCIDDIKSHIDFLENQGYEEIHLSGHSLGAPKVVYYITETNDPRVKTLLLLSPSDMLGLVRGENSDFQKRISTAHKMISDGKGGEIIPEWVWDEYPITADTFVNIFADGSKASIFNFLNPNDGFDILSKVSVPIFAVMGTKDDALTVSIDDTMRMLKENTKSPETHIMQGASHSYHGHEKELATLVADWATRN